jgi:regulator of sirC expression with transglutaminase-like and TPR domain
VTHPSNNPRDRFAEAVSRPDDEINLAEAALLLATPQYPDLNTAHYLAKLDEIAKAVEQCGISTAIPIHIISSLNKVMFLDLGFRGNAENYYDPCNSYLNEVLDRRLGIPITLSVVYMEVARRIGFKLHGVALPGHFIVKYCAPSAEVFIDPFNAGKIMDEQGCADLLAKMSGDRVQCRPEYLVAATNKQILMRMLANLVKIYVDRSDHSRALAAVEWILLVDPDSPAYVRDRGLLLGSMGRPNSALKELERYLELVPDAPDAESIRDQIKRIWQIRASLN